MKISWLLPINWGEHFKRCDNSTEFAFFLSHSFPSLTRAQRVKYTVYKHKIERVWEVISGGDKRRFVASQKMREKATVSLIASLIGWSGYGLSQSQRVSQQAPPKSWPLIGWGFPSPCFNPSPYKLYPLFLLRDIFLNDIKSTVGRERGYYFTFSSVAFRIPRGALSLTFLRIWGDKIFLFPTFDLPRRVFLKQGKVRSCLGVFN